MRDDSTHLANFSPRVNQDKIGHIRFLFFGEKRNLCK